MGTPTPSRTREIPISTGLTSNMRTMENAAPTIGIAYLPRRFPDGLAYFRSKKIVETHVAKYANARRNTAELMRSDRPPSRLATYAALQRMIRPTYGVWNLLCFRLKARGRSPSMAIA